MHVDLMGCHSYRGRAVNGVSLFWGVREGMAFARFPSPTCYLPPFITHTFFGSVLKDLIGLAISPQGKNAMNECPMVTLFGCAWVLFLVKKPCLHVRLFLSIECWRRLNVFCLFRSAECPNAVLRNEGPENHPADPASSFVLGYRATMLREPVPLF